MENDPPGSLLNIIYTPHPVAGASPETLDEYITGPDPETGKPVIEEIIDFLTKPQSLKKPAKEAVSSQSGKPVLLGPDTEENLQDLFYENGWTDGNPIILPTRERVEKMQTGTCADPDEVVAEVFIMDTKELIRPTVTNIAVIAVMAGAKPEHFPVILAIASTGQSSLMPSTTHFESMLLVNGPIAREIGMNSGLAAFSAVNRANSVIGRAWTLMSHCWGFARPKTTLWSSQGNNHTYNNMCVAENEEESVWEPFHVQKGFKREESTVSIFRGWTMINSSGAAANRSVTEELNILYGTIPPVGSNATIILDPLVARDLKEKQGFATKEDFARHLSQNIKMTADRYWKNDFVDMLVGSEADKGVEPYATWRKAAPDELIAPYHRPENINIIVVGGGTSPLFKAADYGHITTVSIDRWMPAWAVDECADGSCGLPDDFDDYND
ncbi:MAG: hypothetical protein QM368_09880 [Bacillota bacterium]|nr:hypothetical protein [Bacillota bacterium]HHU30562.1 hypothetical protein [Bacillota bacterium]